MGEKKPRRKTEKIFSSLFFLFNRYNTDIESLKKVLNHGLEPWTLGLLDLRSNQLS
jgi:hypothetical protein